MWLTAYAGEAGDLPAKVFQQRLRAIADERIKAPIAKVHHGLERIHGAQSDVEAGTTPGKHVVLLDD